MQIGHYHIQLHAKYCKQCRLQAQWLSLFQNLI